MKTAERIVGADKLLKLTVDIGAEVRQIVRRYRSILRTGIAHRPQSSRRRESGARKLRGVESNGMIVAASVGPDGQACPGGLP